MVCVRMCMSNNTSHCLKNLAFGPEPGIDALTESYFYGNLSFGCPSLEFFSMRAHTQSVVQHSHSVTPTPLKLVLKLIIGQKKVHIQCLQPLTQGVSIHQS